MRLFARAFWLVLAMAPALGSAAAARAEEGSSAYALYEKGDYAAAVKAGEAMGDAPGLALAARAALADANLHDTPCLECLKRAEDFARRSIAADPHQTEAQVYLAVTLGYEAHIVGLLRARFSNAAEQAKKALDAALAVNPMDAWSLAALGGWNIEVVHGGGTLLAKALYGASVEEGRALFSRAFAEEPGNPVLRFQYALSLSAVDFDRWHDEIASALRMASMAKPRGAYETMIVDRAGILLGKMDDRSAYLKLVAAYQGYP